MKNNVKYKVFLLCSVEEVLGFALNRILVGEMLLHIVLVHANAF